MPENKKWSVFLDLDNTILDFTWAEKRALFQTLSERGVEPTLLLAAAQEIGFKRVMEKCFFFHSRILNDRLVLQADAGRRFCRERDGF